MITKKATAAAELAEQCRIIGVPMPTHYKGAKDGEFRFYGTRQWRFDVAWTNLENRRAGGDFIVPGPKLALEIDGGNFSKRPCPSCGVPIVMGGRHNSGQGYRDDLEKLNEAIILGWHVMRCLPEQITQGVVITWIERFMFAHHVVLPKSPQPRRSYEPTKEEVREPRPKPWRA